MEPSKKSEEMEQFLTTATGIDRRQSIRSNLCTWCAGPAESFRDELSIREYKISGFCQKCQDDVFS